jgi:hypothetical protein
MHSMIVPGGIVLFRLSPQGASALAGMTGEVNEEVIQALVVAIDELGVWIQYTQSEALLLKWDYFQTAVVDIPNEQPRPARKIGF